MGKVEEGKPRSDRGGLSGLAGVANHGVTQTAKISALCTLEVIYCEFSFFAAQSMWFLPEVGQAGQARVV